MPGKREREEGVYSIGELLPEVRERVLERWRYKIWDDTDSQFLSEEFEQILSERGFINPEVYWSLGSCQGDGVAFVGTLDLKDFFKWVFSGEKQAKPFVKEAKEFVLLQDVASVSIKHHGNYYHSNSMDVEIEFVGTELDFVPEDFRNAIYQWKNRQEGLPRRGPKEWRPGTGMPASIQRKIDEASEKFKTAEAMIGKLEEFIGNWVKDTSKELEKIGYGEIDYRQSDEAITEFLEANEFTFDEDGEEL